MARIGNYEPNDAGYRKMAMSPDILQACMAEAARGKTFAISISPHGNDEGDPGKTAEGSYASQFEVKAGTVSNVGRNLPRVAAFLWNNARIAAAVEFSNARQPKRHRILGRTAEFLGQAGGAAVPRTTGTEED